MCEDDSFLPLELLSSANAAAAVQNENPMTTMKRGTNAPVRPLAGGPPLVEIPHNFFIKTLLLTSNQYPIGCSFRSIEILPAPERAKIEIEQSGQRESNPHGQLGRLELYH
jgi:hypothetical protein